MKKALVLFAAALLIASVAYAQVHYEFHCTGAGNMVKNSPVDYTGAIDGGVDSNGVCQVLADRQ